MRHVREYLEQGHTLANVRSLFADSGLRCIGGFDCAVERFTPAKQRAENHQRILENARFLTELDGVNLVVGTDGPADLQAVPDPIGEMAAVLSQVADTIADTGVTLCVEFNWSPLVKSLRTAAEIARRSGRSNAAHGGAVGVIFDPAHYHCTSTKFDQLTPENVETIRHVHVDDMRDEMFDEELWALPAQEAARLMYDSLLWLCEA